jgi:predicted MFS family arabinose efflux permease
MHAVSPALEYVPVDAAGERRGFQWPLILLLGAIATLNYCDRMALTGVYPLIKADLHVDDVWVGWIGSAFLWTYAIGSPFSGWIADRWSRPRVILCSLLAWSVITLAAGLARTANQLLMLRYLLGLAECAYIPAAVGLLADYHEPRHRGRAIAIHTTGLNVGAMAGATLSGFIGERFGWRAPFVILGAMGIALTVIAALGLRGKDARQKHAGAPPADAHKSPADDARPLLSSFAIPSYWFVVAEGMLIAAAVWTFFNWLSLYFREQFGMGLAGAGFYGSAINDIPAVVGILAGGVVTDMVAKRSGAGRMLVQSICYGVSACLLLTFTHGVTLAWSTVAVAGFGLLRAIASTSEHPLACDLIPARHRSLAVSIMNSANTAAGAGGVLLAGYLKRDLGLTAVFRGTSIVVFAAAVVTLIGFLLFLPRDLRRRGFPTAAAE